MPLVSGYRSRTFQTKAKSSDLPVVAVWDDIAIPYDTLTLDTSGDQVVITFDDADLTIPSESLKDDRNKPVQSNRYFEGDKVAAAVKVYWRYTNQSNAQWRDVIVAYDDAGNVLQTQPVSPVVNRRDDAYGGSLPARMQLAVEIVSAIRSDVADDSFIVAYRIGCNEPTLAEGQEIARRLQDAGVDLLHVSAGMGGTDLPTVPPEFPYDWIVYGGVQVKRHMRVPVIAVSHIRTAQEAAQLVENDVDMVAVGKGQLADPDWASKAQTGEAITTCLECEPQCHWFEDETACPQFKAEWCELG